MEKLWVSFFNLSVLIGFLFYKLRKPTREMIQLRRDNFAETLEKVAKEKSEAQKIYDEFSSKLDSVHSDISALRESAFQERQRLGDQIVEEARRLATQLIQDANQASQVLYQELRRDLKRDLAVQVLNRVEELLGEQLTSEQQNQFERSILSQFKKEAS